MDARAVASVETADGLRITGKGGQVLLDLSGPRRPALRDPQQLRELLQQACDKAVPPEQGQRVLVHVYPDGQVATAIITNPFELSPAPGWEVPAPSEEELAAVLEFARRLGRGL